MAFYDRLKSDNQRILSNDMAALTLTNAAKESHTAKGRWTDIGIKVDAQGIPFVGKSYKVDFHIDDFSILITSVKETFKGWKASFVNNNGETINGYFSKPMVDETFNYVSTNLTTKQDGS